MGIELLITLKLQKSFLFEVAKIKMAEVIEILNNANFDGLTMGAHLPVTI